MTAGAQAAPGPETAATPVPATRRGRVLDVLLLGALSSFAPLSTDMYLPALPGVARELHTSASLAQLSLTACLIGLAAGQVLAGPLSDARGRRRPLLVGLAAYAVASALCVAAPGIWALLVLRLAQGFAGAAGIVIARAVVRDRYQGEAAARFFALLLIVTGAGIIVVGQVSRALIGRVPLRVLLLTGLTGSAVGGLVVLDAALAGLGLPVILPALFLVVASTGLVLPSAMALALDRHGRDAGSASGLLGLAQFGVGAAAAPIVGVAGPHTLLPMGLVMAVLGCGARLIVPRRRAAQAPAANPST